MGTIRVHEFMSLDGVIDAPTWTFDYGFDPEMGEAIARFSGGCDGILLGRTTYEMFEPAWSSRTVDDDPGAPFFNDTGSTSCRRRWRRHLEQLDGRRAVRPGHDPSDQGRQRQRHLRQWERHAGAGAHRRRPRRRAPRVRLPAHARAGPRLFPEDAPPTKWSLADSAAYENGVQYLGYRFEPSATEGSCRAARRGAADQCEATAIAASARSTAPSLALTSGRRTSAVGIRPMRWSTPLNTAGFGSAKQARMTGSSAS